MESLYYSSLSRRFGAFLIDSVILGVIGLIIGNMIPILGHAAVWFFYGPVLESSELRATIGKHLMGIQVLDVTGRRLTFKASLLRNFMKLFSTAFFLLGCAIALFTARKQTAHDLLADSVVVYGRIEMPIIDAWMDQSKEVLRLRDFDSKPSPATAAANGVSEDSIAIQLEKLQALLDRGSLTPEEFEAAKKRVLS